MNTELKLIAAILMQPELRTKALLRKDHFESAVIGDVYEALRTGSVDDITALDQLVDAKIVPTSKLFDCLLNLPTIGVYELEAMCKKVRASCDKRRNPNSHTMAEAVDAAVDKMITQKAGLSQGGAA